LFRFDDLDCPFSLLYLTVKTGIFPAKAVKELMLCSLLRGG